MAQSKKGSSRSSSSKNTSSRSSSSKSSSSRGSSSSRSSSARNSSSSSKSSSANRAHKTKAAMRREQEERQRRRQTASVILFAVAVLFFILYAFPGVSGALHSVITGLFGAVTPILWCMLILFISFQLAMNDEPTLIRTRSFQGLGVVLIVSAYAYLLSSNAKLLSQEPASELVRELYQLGAASKSVGVLGGIIPALLVTLLGRGLTIVLAVLATFVVFMLITQKSMKDIYDGVTQPVKHAGERINEKIVERRENPPERRQHRSFSAYDIQMDEEPKRSTPVREESAAQPARSSRTRKAVFDAEALPEALPVRKPEPAPAAARSAAAAKPKKATSTVAAAPDDFEKILERVENELSNKQLQMEIAAETVQIAREVKENEEQKKEQVREYVYPPIDLLKPIVAQNEGDIRNELTTNAERLIDALNEFGVEASVVDICRGPGVTRYELKPGQGVKINRITNLQKDIALRLAAKAVRIEAPIPGKSAIGIEIPNTNRSIVCIRELIGSDRFVNAKGGVVVSVGKDIEGNIVLADIAKMPHVLIAGATGQGKSVCINSMLMSIVYKYSPEDVRLIMIDPKEIELGPYNGIPHMLVPVVSDPKKAAGALQWAIGEMDKRYSLFKEYNVREIEAYNRTAIERGEAEKKLPKIVIIIDELADLMATSPKEVETSIARLAAKARAAGMHMVLATQRPSVDVITGTIKNNIPCRMAFTVSSSIDARTIMDEGGAENLIGKGDMLYKPVGSKPIRIQGSFVDDSEATAVIDFLKENGEAQYDENIQKQIEQNAANNENGGKQGGGGHHEESTDPLYFEAIDVVVEAGEAAVSMLQRRLGIGYARAGKLIDQLAQQGIVGPYCGSKARPVLISREEYLEMKMRSQKIVDAPTQLTTASVIEQPSSDDAPF